MKTKALSLFASAAVLMLTACGALTVGLAIAGLGIAGAGIDAYCASAAGSCPTALVSFADLIETQATQDAAVFSTGGSTVTEIAAIVANLNAAVKQGQGLTGLTPDQQLFLKAALSSISTVLNLVENLIPPPAVTAPIGAASVQSVPTKNVAWKISSRDRTALQDMTKRIAVARAGRKP